MHSVHLLRTIDEPEALKYLSVLVLNQNPLVRQKALRELMLVKFEKVENLFWQYIGREDQTFLLVKAGLLATSILLHISRLRFMTLCLQPPASNNIFFS